MPNTDSTNGNTLVWFRHDLRIDDNQSLVAACQYAAEHQGVVRAIFFVTPKQWALHDAASIQLDFIERQVNQLAIDLAELGIPLDICHSDDFEAMPALLSQYINYWQIAKVFATSEPECNEQRRDHAVIEAGVDLELSQQHCFLPPLSVLNLSGEMYKVFTPFAKKWREIAKQAPIQTLARPEPIATPLPMPNYVEFDCEKSSSRRWPVGELAAHAKLRQFAKDKVADYQASRDFPAIDGTSQLSAYLAVGIISPRQCLQVLLSHYPDALVHDESPGRCWLNELIWREFYRHLLVAFPKLSKSANFNALADQIKWRNNPREFQAWCEGRTGYPLVDAAMRQLNQTGWMHNRLRMVTASFLTKHLLVDWRWGERYFRQKLIDGDLAANNGGWQWSAGTGCDAQPYFRVFNPISQCEKFDPTGAFIRTYLPELEQVDLKLIHKLKIPTQAQLFVETDYASPIVEHKFARMRAIDVLSAMKKGSANALQVRAQQVRQVGSDSSVDLDKEIFG
ncbi:deoxyribodipyrimidine photo-lyase [Shewanella marinintestina]|uniref:deoxyribodipyrimidine photo-lyase n=1 Tax=Shewanella marinintestina TaxID=190305 RepID=UPI0020103840|nr:deoxyribodipyrimidine photo-lyase [Shewanella marinintestina]MCL1145020.1 deoxyribodipyrimidine photo-lyase [Shewanella marinintestina]